MWLDREIQWAASGKRGRNATLSDTAIQFYLSIKCLFGQPPLPPKVQLIALAAKGLAVVWGVRRAPDHTVQGVQHQPSPTVASRLLVRLLRSGASKQPLHRLAA